MDPVTFNEIPSQIERGPHESYLSALVRALTTVLDRYARRVNQTLPKDGSEPMGAPFPLKSYTVAGLPPAADHEGSVVYVSDGAPAQKVRYSDGSSWVSMG